VGVWVCGCVGGRVCVVCGWERSHCWLCESEREREREGVCVCGVGVREMQSCLRDKECFSFVT